MSTSVAAHITGTVWKIEVKPGDSVEEGQTLVEYGLLLALIAIIVIVALIFLGPIVSQIFQNVGKNLQR